jgi:hypothetical protein
MAISEPVRNGKPDAGGVRDRDRERDREQRERDREREREREWVPRESAQQHHHREREREREPLPLIVNLRDMPLGGPIGATNANASSASINAPPPPPPLAEMTSGSGSSFLSRIGGPYRSPPTASSSFRSDGTVGEQRSWPPEDDWDGATRKRTLAGEFAEPSPSFVHLCNGSFKTGRKTLLKTRAQTWA